jgi:hypothetical protein
MTSTELIPYTKLLRDCVNKLKNRERRLHRVGHLERSQFVQHPYDIQSLANRMPFSQGIDVRQC